MPSARPRPLSSRRCRAAAAVALALAVAPALATAQSYETPKLLGLGGAGAANALGNDALYANPAAIALGNFYSLELGYFDDFQGNDRRLAASITDGFDKRITGGVGYVYRDRLLAENGAAADLTRTIHRFDVALAAALGGGAALGVTGRYVTASDALGEDDVEDGGYGEFTFDAAAMWRGSSGLSLALVGTNLTDSDQADLPMRLGGGVGFSHELFTAELDARYDFRTEKPWLGGSVGLLLGSTFAVRAGVSHDFATQTTALSAGVGVSTGQFAADLGFRQRIAGDGPAPGLDTERIFALSVRGVPFR